MKLSLWHWHRLRAMGPAEIARRLARKVAPIRPPRWGLIESARPFPAVSPAKILFDGFKAFGTLPLPVDDPPRWNCDYLAGVEAPAGGNHRRLEAADIKLIWELSRWHELARMAQAGERAKCLAWLEDWVAKNPPYSGWNWTSALESGLRLIHFAWIDALLDAKELRTRIVPPHVHFTWRERSFGSSANNHLMGELAGLIGAVARWPELSEPSLERLQREWEREVLAQFAEDGGNREQALNYHVFSLDLCQFTRAALRFAGRTVAPEVEQRLAAAEEFLAVMQVRGERWDYGDSDDATIFGAAQREPRLLEENQWHYFDRSGMARHRSGEWELRWDLSPLGYLRTAAHGHLDALHLSIWWKEMAVVIDPGTGAYYADAALRNALASWEAHNGPHLPAQAYPQRVGPFLWAEHHRRPTWHSACGELQIPQGKFSRRVTSIQGGWQVEDACEPHRLFMVRWQFAPGAEIAVSGKNSWRLRRKEACFDIEVSGGSGAIGEAVVSPGFRQTARAPFLEVRTGSEPCVLRTLFSQTH